MDFSMFPLWLREGPWAWSTYIAFFIIFCGLTLEAKASLKTFIADDGGPDMYGIGPRIAGSIWGIGILVFMVATVGPWPFCSYTMVSWTLVTLRYLTRLGGWSAAASALRFPSLVGNTITIIVWWLVLVPILLAALPKGQRRGFAKFNGSFFLVNVHLLNGVLATADVLLAPRLLNMADLWIGIACGVAYLIFYLLVLDPRGLHFYIILTPRTRFSLVVYLSLLGCYYGVFCMWNAVMTRWMQSQ